MEKVRDWLARKEVGAEPYYRREAVALSTCIEPDDIMGINVDMGLS